MVRRLRGRWIGLLAGVVLVTSSCMSAGEEPAAEPSPAPEQTTAAPGEDPVEAAFAALLDEHRVVDYDPGDEPTPEAAYGELLERHEADLASCARERGGQERQCERPRSLADDLEEVVNVQLLLDASGSMAGPSAGGTKMQVARRVLTDFVDSLPDNANVSVRLFGHIGTGSGADRARSCAGTDATDFTPASDGAAQAAIAAAEPAGWTPLAAALQAARRDFAGLGEEPASNFVYVISDGIETCDGNPVAAARQLAAAGVGVEVNFVGFDVDREAARQLRRAAGAAGGQYADASDAAELAEAFDSYDWNAWTRYYNCRWLGAQSEYNASFLAVQGNYNCLFLETQRENNGVFLDAQRAYNNLFLEAQREYNAIFAALRPLPPDERAPLEQLARERREALTSVAQEIRDYARETSRERRDTIQSAARERRVDLLEEARDRRDAILEEARAARDAARGSED